MYVACTRAMDRLCFSDSEGFNVQNSLSKYPSRFIREAKDDFDGYAYYDIVGQFDPELWKGTDRLIQSLEKPEPTSESPFSVGANVHHTVFGDGVITREDKDNGTVIVKFEGFGVRRLKPENLKPAE